jgi:hypothetical protein
MLIVRHFNSICVNTSSILLSSQKSQGETGWDIFSLNYRVDLPISVVLHSDAMRKGYYRMFHFLWRLKRVDHLLGRAWQSHVSDHMHKLDKLPKYKGTINCLCLLQFMACVNPRVFVVQTYFE